VDAFLKSRKGRVQIHLGERDQIIPPSVGRRFAHHTQVTLHPFGHGLIRPEVLDVIFAPTTSADKP